jgi:hypothetical protein
MGIAYDFRPTATGTDIIVRSFYREKTPPVLDQVVNFTDFVYDAWLFGVSVMVDTG